MGLSNNPIVRKCVTEVEASVQVLCECEALASLRHAYLGSFFLDPEDIRKLIIGAIWKFSKGTGLLLFSDRTGGTEGLFQGLGASGPEGLEPKYHSFSCSEATRIEFSRLLYYYSGM